MPRAQAQTQRDMLMAAVHIARADRDLGVGLIADRLAALVGIGRRVQKLDEDEMNYGLTDAAKDRRQKLLNAARVHAAALKCELIPRDDVRGYCIILKLPGGQSNRLGENWGLV